MLRLLKLRPLVSSSLQTLTTAKTTFPTSIPHPPLSHPLSNPHLLLLRLPVSSTPKGKARLKSIQPNKKSSFKKNKAKTPAFDPKSKSNPYLATKIRTLPLRLNAKLRSREAVRESLGLHSKLAKRDLEIRKAREAPPQPLMGLEGMDLAELGIVDADAVRPFELTVEDGRRLAKEYSRVMMIWHRKRQAAETVALEVRRAAIEAMPEDLRRKALVPVVKRKKKGKEAVGGKKMGKLKVVSGKKPAVTAGKKGGGKGGKKG